MTKDFKDILKELKVLKKQLNEEYLFNGNATPMDDDEIDMYDDENMPMEQEPQPQQASEGDSQEEIAMHAQDVIQHEPIIGKIRETAIEGLKKYSDNPTSALYEFFKKVFLESDKVLTDNGSSKK
jgi:hypothetical protein